MIKKDFLTAMINAHDKLTRIGSLVINKISL